MIDCPECQTAFSGNKCPACGHMPKSTPVVNADAFRTRMQQEAEFDRQCREWLDNQHITEPWMSTSERMKAMAAYREKMKSPMLHAVEPKSWAYSLKSDYLDGVHLLTVQIENASASLGEVWQGGQCMPRKGEMK